MSRRKTQLPFPESGKLIKKYRQARGYSTRELAELANMDYKYLSSVESCGQMAGIRYLYNLAARLNVPIERLLVPSNDTVQNEDVKSRLIADLDQLSDDEIVLLSKLLYQCLPYTRSIKEY